ncbi:hypothetical protein IEQ34_010022 [Dendrobium chrysotoxum]|uniref:Uncharacterized protein n=1 Tax=Dendrobium chrysotoxum TaxID=161865 RepID=A0AAV7H0N1_DENCH|nr:hypothetical protein IEQ34_010022 [Dendrobium chrysotoxum]
MPTAAMLETQGFGTSPVDLSPLVSLPLTALFFNSFLAGTAVRSTPLPERSALSGKTLVISYGFPPLPFRIRPLLLLRAACHYSVAETAARPFFFCLLCAYCGSLGPSSRVSAAFLLFVLNFAFSSCPKLVMPVPCSSAAGTPVILFNIFCHCHIPLP